MEPNKRDSFIFYRSFFEATKPLSQEQKAELFDCICEFALNGEQIKMSDIPKAMFQLIKPQLEANQRRYENGNKGGRPKSKQTETKKKPNNNQTETKAEANVNDNVNDNVNVNDTVNDNIINNNNIISKDMIEQAPEKEENQENIDRFKKMKDQYLKKKNYLSNHENSTCIVQSGNELEKEKSPAKKEKESFGNEDINDLLEIIKKHNNGIIDGTVREQRQYGNHLINKLKKFDKVANGEYTRQKTIELLLDIVGKNEYHCSKIGGPKKIYYSLSELMQIAKSEITKQEKNKIVKF